MMDKKCYEVSLRFPCDRVGAEEALQRVLSLAGVSQEALVMTSSGRYMYLTVYYPAQCDAARLVKRIETFQLKNIQVRVNHLKPAEWRDKWKDDIRPFHLTPRIDVVPSWAIDSYRRRKREPIILDTTLAFGTGLHETTRFMAHFIERYAGKFESFLDIGTGTGILSIVAQKNGAKKIWALDIDEGSIRTAQQNCVRNAVRLDWRRAMDFRHFREKKQFDFVAANVITDELIVMREKIAAAVKPEKYLAISGISLENLTRLKNSFKDQPLRCLRILTGKKWAAIFYKKIKAEGLRIKDKELKTSKN